MGNSRLKKQSRLVSSSLLVSLALFSAGCGKKGPMIYPDLLVPEAPAYIMPEQSGRILRLAFDLPAKDLAGRKLKEKSVLAGVKVIRFVGTDSENFACKACPEGQKPFRKIDLEYPGAGVVLLGNRMILSDSDVTEGNKYSYSVVGYLKDGTEGKPSRLVSAVLTAPPVPPVLKAVSSLGVVRIVVDMPEFFDGDGEVLGVRLVKLPLSAVDEVSESPVATVSPYSPMYEDRAVQPASKYRYSGRTIFKRPDGILAESEASAPVEIVVSDAP